MPSEWIGDGRALERFQTAPARHFRGEFKVGPRPVRARLYVSAMGLVEPWLNGRPVTEDRFVPGWPDYRRRMFYAAYDVTPLLQEGDNTLGLILGDGWYSGTMIPRHQYGPEAMCSAFLDLTEADGKVTTIVTGEGWHWTDAGPITMNSIYDGDAQVFAPTALYNMEAGAFYRQWLYSLRDGLRDDPNGGFPVHTGDRQVLAENLPAIQHALELPSGAYEFVFTPALP